jgi:hypothetical protein
MSKEKDDIVLDEQFRVIVDDVSNAKAKEFRASVYDSDSELVGEGWGETKTKAIGKAFENLEGGF